MVTVIDGSNDAAIRAQTSVVMKNAVVNDKKCFFVFSAALTKS